MSLLSDLALAYETLADDPIEMGIHYGKSVLKALSGSTKQTETTLRGLPTPAVRSKVAVRTRMISRVQPQASRRDFSAAYSIRPRQREVVARQPQRSMVGAL